MKNEEIRALSVEQLQQQIGAEQDQLLKLQFAHAVSPIENPMRLRAARKLIARLHTELTQKTRQAQTS